MKRFQPALLAGAFIGILSILPFVNFCCCLWVILGGLLVPYLQQQARETPIDTAEAVLGGLIAGLVGGILMAGFQFLTVNPADPEALAESAEFVRRMFGDSMPADFEARMMEMASNPFVRVAQAGVIVLMYAVFAIVGALIGVALFRKKLPPAPTVQG